MKKIYRLTLVLLVLSLSIVVGCSKKDDPTPDNVTVELENPINNFVWRGMNSWYNWQENVSNLADSKDDDKNEFYSYLNNYSNPETLFTSLRYQPDEVDRFSWFIDDYVAHGEQSQGIITSFGMYTQGVIISNNGDNDPAILYVRYVEPDSPAGEAGFKRGDIISALDDVVLNEQNYSATVSKMSNETVKFTIVNENNGNLDFIEDRTITKRQVNFESVHFTKIFDNINGRKVGYLVYRSFSASHNDELNAAFAEFAAQGVNEFVLDLRVNGGGSVLTSAYLASMIYAAAGTDVFCKLVFNGKHSNEDGSYNFYNTVNIYNSNWEKTGEEAMNRLAAINRLYVITSGNTASASEMVINGLKPFIPVKLFGTQTYGKNVGSITLYDSPTTDYTKKTNANPDHKNAMQPIVFQIYNKNDQSDYIHGFAPDVEIKEWYSWENIYEFGDENEELLKAVLDDIRGLSSKPQPVKIDAQPLDVPLYDFKRPYDMVLGSDYFDSNKE